MNDSIEKSEDLSLKKRMTGKYLTFLLKDEPYGISVRPINDIIEMQKYSHVPRMPDYMRGVINLRGHVIPIIDLRRKFGMETKEYDKKTCIIVVTIAGIQTGLIVDTVCEIIDLSEEHIDPTPPMGSEVETRFLAGMGRYKDQIVILLDLEKVLKKEEADKLKMINDTTKKEV